jgi:hypothetical protein
MRDIDIRKEIKSSFLKKFYEDSNSKVVEELGVNYGDAIIDIAVINGSLHGFEIKSEFDTLNRLQNQISTYCKTFDFLTIITAEKHLMHLSHYLPEWCGIIVINKKESINDTQKLKYIKRPKKNPNTDKFSIVKLLWRDETLAILNSIGVTRGVKNKSKPLLWELLANSLDKKVISEKVRETLKTRVNWKSEQLPCENDGYFQLSSKS